MEYKFKKLSDLETIDELPESGHVVGLDEHGAVKKTPVKTLGKVKTVNNTEPDEKGNINIEAFSDEKTVQSIENIGLISLARKDDNTVFTDKNGNALISRNESVQEALKTTAKLVETSPKEAMKYNDVVLGLDEKGKLKKVPSKSFVKTVNNTEPDENGNIEVGTVKTVNNAVPDKNGNVTIFESFVGVGETKMVGVMDPAQAIDCVNGDEDYYYVINENLFEFESYFHANNATKIATQICNYMKTGVTQKVIYKGEQEYICEPKQAVINGIGGEWAGSFTDELVYIGNPALILKKGRYYNYPETLKYNSEDFVDTGEPFVLYFIINDDDPRAYIVVKTAYNAETIDSMIYIQSLKEETKTFPLECLPSKTITIPYEKIGYENDNPGNYTFQDLQSLRGEGYNIQIIHNDMVYTQMSDPANYTGSASMGFFAMDSGACYIDNGWGYNPLNVTKFSFITVSWTDPSYSGQEEYTHVSEYTKRFPKTVTVNYEELFGDYDVYFTFKKLVNLLRDGVFVGIKDSSDKRNLYSYSHNETKEDGLLHYYFSTILLENEAQCLSILDLYENANGSLRSKITSRPIPESKQIPKTRQINLSEIGNEIDNTEQYSLTEIQQLITDGYKVSIRNDIDTPVKNIDYSYSYYKTDDSDGLDHYYFTAIIMSETPCLSIIDMIKTDDSSPTTYTITEKTFQFVEE